MEHQAKDKKKVNTLTIGCGIILLIVLFFVVPFVTAIRYHEHGENKPTAPIYNAEKGKNFSYDFSFMHQFCEFDISEVDFLDWCKTKEISWELVEIETLPSLPEVDRNKLPRINHQRNIPLLIARYCCRKTEHEECYPWTEKCQVDTTGKTNKACFHIVENGYYYESRWSNSGGVYVLYDRENSRCYIHVNKR